METDRTRSDDYRLALFTSPLLTPTALSGTWTLKEQTLVPNLLTGTPPVLVTLDVKPDGAVEGRGTSGSIEFVSCGHVVGPCGGHLYRCVAI